MYTARSTIKLLSIALCFLSLSAPVFAARGVNKIYYAPGWTTQVKESTKAYVDVTRDRYWSLVIYAAKADGGVDNVWGDVIAPIPNNTTVYNALATDCATYGLDFYGARATGGVDRITYTGGVWVTASFPGPSATIYLDITEDRGLTGVMYGSGVNGGVDYRYAAYGGGYVTINSGTLYGALATDAMYAYTIYAARINGGVDIIYWNGAWQAVQINTTNTYVALTRDATSTNCVYGARANGGIDKIYYNGSQWVTSALPYSVKYTDLTFDKTLSQCIYGVKAEGGMDTYAYSGGWGFAPNISTAWYSALCNDATSGYCVYGAVIEDNM